MANVANLTVRIGAEIGGLIKGVSNAGKQLDAMGDRLTSVGKTLSTRLTAPIVAFAGLSVSAFGKQEQAERKLAAAIRATGGAVDSNMDRFKSFATEMQRLTVVGDETTLALLQVATSSGLSAVQAERAARNAISMQSAFGTSAEAAIRMTAALEQGDATMLRRYIPALRGVTDNTEAVSVAQRVLAESFDIAKEEAKTSTGQITQLRNAFGDFMESVGSVIAEAITPFILRLTALAERLQTIDREIMKQAVLFGALAAAIGPATIALGLMAKAIAVILSPIMLKIAALAALASGINYVAVNAEAFAERFQYYFAIAKNAVLDSVSSSIQALGRLVAFVDAVAGASLIGFGATISNMKSELSDPDGFTQFGSYMDSVTATIGKARVMMMDFIATLNLFPNVDETAQGFDRATISAIKFGTTAPNMLSKVGDSLAAIKAKSDDFTMSAVNMGEALQTQVTTAIQSFTTTLGNAFTGDAGAEGFFNNILLIVADFGTQLGKALIAAGVAALAFKTLLANPFAAIAAGAALVATSAIVRNKLLEGPSTSVNDALITSRGDVIKFHPDDNILAMKDFGNLQPSPVAVNTNSMDESMLMKAFSSISWELRGDKLYTVSQRGGLRYER